MAQALKPGGKPSLLVVVWEWKNKQGRWRPYSPEVTQQLERAFMKNLRFVFLGDADPALKDYCVELSSLQQKCSVTGKLVHVRRHLYPQSSAAGQGVVWQWAGDVPRDWRIYDMAVQCALEEFWTSGAQTLDLSEIFPGCPYVINFYNMNQKNKKTGFTRSIVRKTQAAYPIGRPVTPDQHNHNVHVTPTAQIPVFQSIINVLDKKTKKEDSELSMKTEQTGARGLFSKVLHLAGSSGTNVKNSSLTPSTNKGPDVSTVRKPPKPLPRYINKIPIPKPRTRFSMPTNAFNADPRESPSYCLLGSNTTIDSDSSSTHTSVRRPSVETICTYLSQDSANDDNYSLLSYGPQMASLIHIDDSLSDDDVFLVDREVSAVMSRAISQRANSVQIECGTKRSCPYSAIDCIDPLPKQIQKMSSIGIPETAKEKLLVKHCRAVLDPPNDVCSICLDKLSETSGFDDSCISNYLLSLSVCLTICQHLFHEICLLQSIASPQNRPFIQCPNCKLLYGEKWGNQPHGSMKFDHLLAALPGYSDCGTIRITYTIESGIQEQGHPRPGHAYFARDFPRVCYLPSNPKGKKVLHLLREAFRRRLIFTVGDSVTTGQHHVVTWNEIHHKTEWKNRTGHGYPDPNYLDNVLQELSWQGVTEESLV